LKVHPLARQPSPSSLLVNVPRLVMAYCTERPDPSVRARPSGTEAVYKLYAESFKGHDHLRSIHEEAQAAIRGAVRTKAAG
jgi:phosphomannomutase